MRPPRLASIAAAITEAPYHVTGTQNFPTIMFEDLPVAETWPGEAMANGRLNVLLKESRIQRREYS
jgi:hypothetical protein